MHAPYFRFLLIFCALASGAQELAIAQTRTCAEKSVAADAVRTLGDVQAFVQCAYEFVQEVGAEEARRAFNEEERWKSGPTYIFVDEVTPMTDMARAFVFPPDPSREGESWGLLIDAFGETFLYYSNRNPAANQWQRKVTFVKRITSFGVPVLIGAGYYLD